MIALNIDQQQPKVTVASAAEASKKTPIDDTQYSSVRMDTTKVQIV
jgi:hypothetical protein